MILLRSQQHSRAHRQSQCHCKMGTGTLHSGGVAQQREGRPPFAADPGGGTGGGAPVGWDASLPAPEQLPPGDAQLAEPLEPALGTFLCRC